MATFTTYDVVGAAEDVQDVISKSVHILHVGNPTTSISRVYQYQQDALAAAAIIKRLKLHTLRWQH